MIKLLLDNCITQQDLLNEYNANVTYVCLPKRINGFIYCYKNVNSVFINHNLSVPRQRRIILHELAHIELNHLYKSKECLNFCLLDLEDEADKYIKRLEEL